MTGATLKKDITSTQLFSLAFGSIIGVGWITVLGLWVAQAGPFGAAIAFTAGGSAILLIGLCYAEMATAIPVAGGEVAYAHEAFGLKASFVVGWMLVLGYVGVVILEVISVGWILEAMIPSLRGPILYKIAGSNVTLGSLIAGIVGMLLIAAFNIRGAKYASRLQEWLVYALLLTTVAFAAFAFVYGDTAHLRPHFVFSSTGTIWPGIMAVLVTAPFWFSGFDVIPQAMGERSKGSSLELIPIVMAVAIGVAILFYIMVIFAASMSLPRSALLAADLPTAEAIATALGSDFGGKMVLFAGFLGLVSSWNAFTYGASRVLFALGRASIIFPKFGELHPTNQTPANAIIFLALIGIVGSFFGRSAIGAAVDTGSLGFAMVFFIVCLCAIQYRRITANAASYTMPGGSVTRLTASVLAFFIVGYAVYSPARDADGIPIEWTLFIAWAIIGLVLYVSGAKHRGIISTEERRARILTDI